MANLFGWSGLQPIRINVGFNKIITPWASSIQKAVVNIPKSQNQPQLITKTFGNRDTSTQIMERHIRDALPAGTDPKIISEAARAAATSGVEELVDTYQKNKTGVAYVGKYLPENTEWKDIKILISKINEKDPLHSTVIILLRGKQIAITNFHEMCLEDTVKNRISITGKILLFMSLDTPFSWHEDVIPEVQKKAKERLSWELQKFFWIKSDPFVLEGKSYRLQFESSIAQKSLLQQRFPKFLQKSVFDILNDSPIFS